MIRTSLKEPKDALSYWNKKMKLVMKKEIKIIKKKYLTQFLEIGNFLYIGHESSFHDLSF